MPDAPISPASLQVPNKLNVPLVKQQELCLLSNASCMSLTQEEVSASLTSSSSQAEATGELILRLGWKLRVHAYLAKFVAACGALSLSLATIGFVSVMPPAPLNSATRAGRLSAGLQDAHSAEWVGAVMLAAGLANLWVGRGRISLLLAFGANLIAMAFAGTGLCVSCILLGLYFSQRDSSASTQLLNASLLVLFVLLAQLSGLGALVTHSLIYHPYRAFARANVFLFQQQMQCSELGGPASGQSTEADAGSQSQAETSTK
ncbi:hypothetical protein BOX15_Mlig033618g1 [Macrostomum lignano]|uniref:Uncharacterized protein n=1 Tax=Macrostomum lignano TaxID=282301 RepID=A0A267GYP3_9PLAT|nr:hypothetical protein BOX15_Mlig033618g1 [Macrostomum lignano]